MRSPESEPSAGPKPGGPVSTLPGTGRAPETEDWLSELFGRHSGAVHAYARRRVDTAEDAEDVVVEVFTTAWRRRSEVPAEPLPWLYATAANVIAHVLRSEARRTRLGARLASVSLHAVHADPATSVTDEVAAADVIGTALNDLAESDAELLRLWAWEQLEPTDIAAVLGCTPGTARTRLHRARARLRAALLQRGVGDAELGPTDGSPDGAVPSATTAAALPQPLGTPPSSPGPAPGTPTPSSRGDQEVLP